ncbi:DUF7669 domain-containing protein [Novipirellula sp. SH528]|uniref:DUF7669 domain-containing protein n=1 Tax=Novipirellula sp. SH528 TaxID=3454466 RepID=UPI003FA0A506
MRRVGKRSRCDVRVSRRQALTRAIAKGSARPLPAALGEVTGGDVRACWRQRYPDVAEGSIRPPLQRSCWGGELGGLGGIQVTGWQPIAYQASLAACAT